jgi:hypothetical protein
MDSLRRGYLADHYFSPVVDYTRCEVPVTLKLQHGHIRTWPEVDGPLVPPRFHYIGDQNPVGPRVWKTRILLFVQPDYIVLFDRVFGNVPHRFNLHLTADSIRRDGPQITAHGRFDLDALLFVQHPSAFEFDQGELRPGACNQNIAGHAQRQHFLRLYNATDGVYRTVLFARERGRLVRIESLGASGVKIVTDQYTDYAFLNDQPEANASFTGRVGWIRREAGGTVIACVPDGHRIEAFRHRIEGRGPWSYNMAGKQEVSFRGPPRNVTVRTL